MEDEASALLLGDSPRRELLPGLLPPPPCGPGEIAAAEAAPRSSASSESPVVSGGARWSVRN